MGHLDIDRLRAANLQMTPSCEAQAQGETRCALAIQGARSPDKRVSKSSHQIAGKRFGLGTSKRSEGASTGTER